MVSLPLSYSFILLLSSFQYLCWNRCSLNFKTKCYRKPSIIAILHPSYNFDDTIPPILNHIHFPTSSTCSKPELVLLSLPFAANPSLCIRCPAFSIIFPIEESILFSPERHFDNHVMFSTYLVFQSGSSFCFRSQHHPQFHCRVLCSHCTGPCPCGSRTLNRYCHGLIGDLGQICCQNLRRQWHLCAILAQRTYYE